MIFWCARASALSGCGVWGPGCASDLGLWQANLAQFLHNAEWVQSDTLKTIENTVVPVIQLTTRRLTPIHRLDCPHIAEDIAPDGDSRVGSEGAKGSREMDVDACVKLDVTFEGPNHQGLSAVSLVLSLLQDFPALEPLFVVVSFSEGQKEGRPSGCVRVLSAHVLRMSDLMRVHMCRSRLCFLRSPSIIPTRGGSLLSDYCYS